MVRKRREQEAERARILAEARDDHADRFQRRARAGTGASAPASSSTMAPSPAAPVTRSNQPDLVRLQIRCPQHSRTIVATCFAPSATIGELHDYVKEAFITGTAPGDGRSQAPAAGSDTAQPTSSQYDAETLALMRDQHHRQQEFTRQARADRATQLGLTTSITISSVAPRREFTDMTMTLAEAGLSPSATVVCSIHHQNPNQDASVDAGEAVEDSDEGSESDYDFHHGPYAMRGTYRFGGPGRSLNEPASQSRPGPIPVSRQNPRNSPRSRSPYEANARRAAQVAAAEARASINVASPTNDRTASHAPSANPSDEPPRTSPTNDHPARHAGPLSAAAQAALRRSHHVAASTTTRSDAPARDTAQPPPVARPTMGQPSSKQGRLAERERILRDLQEDKEEKRIRSQPMRVTADSGVSAPPVSSTSQFDASKFARIHVRKGNGIQSSLSEDLHYLPPQTLLDSLHQKTAERFGVDAENIQLRLAFPPRTILTGGGVSSAGATLASSNLTPSAAVIVERTSPVQGQDTCDDQDSTMIDLESQPDAAPAVPADRNETIAVDQEELERDIIEQSLQSERRRQQREQRAAFLASVVRITPAVSERSAPEQASASAAQPSRPQSAAADHPASSSTSFPLGLDARGRQLRAQELERWKQERAEERRQILQQVASDRAERSTNPTSPVTQQPSSSGGASSSTNGPRRAVQNTNTASPSRSQLRIRLPNGLVLLQEFDVTEPARAVLDAVRQDIGNDESFTLVIPFPRHTLSEAELDEPLGAFDLAPAGSVNVQPTSQIGQVLRGAVWTERRASWGNYDSDSDDEHYHPAHSHRVDDILARLSTVFFFNTNSNFSSIQVLGFFLAHDLYLFMNQF